MGSCVLNMVRARMDISVATGGKEGGQYADVWELSVSTALLITVYVARTSDFRTKCVCFILCIKVVVLPVEGIKKILIR